MAEIRIRDLSKHFGSMRALDSVSLTVASGEVVALLGPSGCGKTTMLRCLAGLEQPSSGRIELGNQTLLAQGRSVPPSQRNISMVFQSYALWPHMTVQRNIEYGLRLQRLPKVSVEERVKEVISLTGLGGLANRYPGELSGGQQQRVAVARAIALRADVVLFDEPLSNLDVRLREEVRLELRRMLKDLGVTAVYVTHDISEAVVVADRVAVMEAGRIIQLGLPEEIYHRPQADFVARFVGDINVVPARISRRNGHVEAEVGGSTLVLPHRLSTDIGGASDVHLLIRPEYIDVHDGVGDSGATGVIESVQFLGQTTMIVVDLGGVRVRSVMLSRPDSKVSVGCSCTLQFGEASIVGLVDRP